MCFSFELSLSADSDKTDVNLVYLYDQSYNLLKSTKPIISWGHYVQKT